MDFIESHSNEILFIVVVFTLIAALALVLTFMARK